MHLPSRAYTALAREIDMCDRGIVAVVVHTNDDLPDAVLRVTVTTTHLSDAETITDRADVYTSTHDLVRRRTACGTDFTYTVLNASDVCNAPASIAVTDLASCV